MSIRRPVSDGPGTAVGELPAESAEVVTAARRRARALNGAEPQLREAVELFAVRARAAGLPPQRLLIDLKQLLAAGALGPMDPRMRGIIVERAVRWAIRGYYSSLRSPAKSS